MADSEVEVKGGQAVEGISGVRNSKSKAGVLVDIRQVEGNSVRKRVRSRYSVCARPCLVSWGYSQGVQQGPAIILRERKREGR